MGLLDNIDEPTMAMAMGLLGSGGYSRMPVSTGQGMAAGFGAYQEAKRAQQEMAMRQADAGMRRDMFDLNKQQHQMQLDQMQRAQADRDTAKANLQAYVSAMPDGPQKQQIIQAVQMGIPMTEVWKKLNPEAKLETVFTQDGREQKAWTAPGQDIVPVGGAKAMPLHFANTGNAIVGVNPITGQPVGQGLQMQVSPDARLSAGTAMRGQNMTDARARENLTFQQQQAGKPQFKDGYWVVPPGAGQATGQVIETPLSAPPKGSAKANQQSSARIIPLLDQADSLLNQSTGSYIGTGVDLAAQAIGASTSGAKASAQLKALEGAIMMAQPRMEGPQSDKDVALYRQMAGQIGDSTVPIGTRRAALDGIRSLHSKYAGTGGAISGAGGGWSATVIK